MLRAFAGRGLALDEARLPLRDATPATATAPSPPPPQLRHRSATTPTTCSTSTSSQCSMLVDRRDLAMMGATLANDGVNPLTGDRAIDRELRRSVLSVMTTCGMYDYAGSWLYRVGLPAKSGVAGGIIAVLPGQLGIGVFSPPLDARGNSVRGVAVCASLLARVRPPPPAPARASRLGHRRHVRARRVARSAAARARRTRLPLRARPRGQRPPPPGRLVLSTAEVAIRAAIEHAGEQPDAAIIFDCQRVPSINRPARQLLQRFAAALAARGGAAVIAGLGEGESYEPAGDSSARPRSAPSAPSTMRSSGARSGARPPRRPPTATGRWTSRTATSAGGCRRRRWPICRRRSTSSRSRRAT